MTAELIPLDALWAEARKAHRESKVKAPPAPPPEPGALFRNPENWTRLRSVALVHTETQTLLGHFDELVHKSVEGCRRLVRAPEGSATPSAIEYVSGSWWLGEERQVVPRKDWHSTRPLIVSLDLAGMGLRAQLAEVLVHLEYDAVVRVELAQTTTFAALSGDFAFMALPQGLDIIHQLSRETKIEIKKELGI